MRRTATALSAEWVSHPQSGEDCWRVITDYRPENEAEFYLRHDGPRPAIGMEISYDDQHVWWHEGERVIVAHKVGYNDDPSRRWL